MYSSQWVLGQYCPFLAFRVCQLFNCQGRCGYPKKPNVLLSAKTYAFQMILLLRSPGRNVMLLPAVVGISLWPVPTILSGVWSLRRRTVTIDWIRIKRLWPCSKLSHPLIWDAKNSWPNWWVVHRYQPSWILGTSVVCSAIISYNQYYAERIIKAWVLSKVSMITLSDENAKKGTSTCMLKKNISLADLFGSVAFLGYVTFEGRSWLRCFILLMCGCLYFVVVSHGGFWGLYGTV